MSVIKTATKVFQSPTASGTFTCTITNLGWTPKAVLLHGIGAQSTDTFEAHYESAHGVSTDTDQWYIQAFDQDAQAQVRCWSRVGRSNCLRQGNLKGGTSLLTSIAPVANGWVFQETGTTTAGYYFQATFFGGADLSVSAGAKTLSVTTTVTITTGHDPDLVFGCMADTDGNEDEDNTHMSESFGVAANDGSGTYTKGNIAAGSQYNWGSSRNCMGVWNDRIATVLYANSVRFSVNFNGGWSSNGFLVDSVGNPRGNALFWLSMNTGDRSVFGAVKATSATTGGQTFTLGFSPQLAGFHLADVSASATNVLSTGGRANVIGMATYDGTRYTGSHVAYSENGQGTTDTATNYHTAPIHHYRDSQDIEEIKTETIAFQSDGVSVSYTVNGGASLFVVWGIEAEASAAGTPVTVMYDFYKMMRGGV